MKIQIDTIAKTLKVEQDVKLEELVAALDKLLPGEWKNFTLQTNITWQWANPIVITPHYHRPYWAQPWYVGDRNVTCQSDDKMLVDGNIHNALNFQSPPSGLKAGVFNVEYKI